MTSVKCEGEKCIGSIILMPNNSACSYFLKNENYVSHKPNVTVQPETADNLCPTSITYDPCKFGKNFHFLLRIKLFITNIVLAAIHNYYK